ncbi:MAG: cytochrome c biogenesis protein CcsA [Flavobacteriales bacterium]|nr:cytochrome c biogenesis protein CcsA [Flavobacteriales bacterium]
MGLAWWKWLSVILITYDLIAGLLIDVPKLPILNESIRNLFYHVTQWFGMMILLTVSLVHSILHLVRGDMRSDRIAAEGTKVALFMGVLGVLTGSLWARFTWGDWWTNDPKLNGVAMGMLVYLAYVVLRGSMEEEQKRGRVAAVYNIFAYVMFMVFIMVLPRLTDSLHPGNGGNPGFGGYDLNYNMKLVFYPAIIGWTLLGVWLLNVRVRLLNLIEENGK